MKITKKELNEMIEEAVKMRLSEEWDTTNDGNMKKFMSSVQNLMEKHKVTLGNWASNGLCFSIQKSSSKVTELNNKTPKVFHVR